jgi:curved DNA-binding protein CbpA
MSGTKKLNVKMKFFVVDEDTTPEDLKRRYRILCRQHHPDKGGCTETQAQINDEYQTALQQLSELAARKGDRETNRQLLQMIEQHLRSMYADMKTPLIKKYVPQQYQGLAFEVAKIIEKSISSP